MKSTAIAKIDLSALTHNLQLLRQTMPEQKILAMVKCNAYGHGLLTVAKTISTVDALGVATLWEALQLRGAGIQTPIVVMRGFATESELSAFFQDTKLYACIHDETQIALLSAKQFECQKPLKIWLKVDTGMNRLGILPGKFLEAYQRLMTLPWIAKPFVICSHLADADNEDTLFTQQQIAHFDTLTKSIATEKSLLNSAGILTHAHAHYDWIRPGLILYGVSPFIPHCKNDDLTVNFKPVMTLESKLIAIKNIAAGEKIGYSCTFTALRDMKMGMVGMGYGDGYPRNIKNGTSVLIRGIRCPIVGRVSMDMITVDVSHLSTVAIDDAVMMWGAPLSVCEIAQQANTIPHELLCHLTGRVQTEYHRI